MEARQLVRQCRYSPVAVGTNEAVTIFRVAKGHRILSVSAKVLVNQAAGQTATVAVGDGTTANSMMAAKVVTAANFAVGALIQGDGTQMQQGGLLCTADTNVTVTYTANSATGADPALEFCIIYQREWPF